jgi:hypothetical protein
MNRTLAYHKEPAGENAREKIYNIEKEHADQIRDELDSQKHIRP